MTLQCSEFGLLTGSPTCERVDCGSTITTLPDHAIADCTGLTDTRYGGQACVASCEDGYEVNGDPNFECGETGLWESTMTCEPVDCGPSIDGLPDNAQADCTASSVFGGTPCLATCVTGYELVPGETGLFTCTADGTWEGSIECKLRDCGTSVNDVPANAIDVECTGSTLYGGDDCVLECETGYEPMEGT